MEAAAADEEVEAEEAAAAEEEGERGATELPPPKLSPTPVEACGFGEEEVKTV